MSEDLITKVQKEFDTIKPLPLNDRRYVECSAERGSVDLLDRMARAIRRQESTCQLLCGYRGSGKTTELFRLRRLLESKEPRQFVVYCEADKYINLGDVEYPDVLLGIVQRLWRDANAQEVQLNEGKLESLLAEVVELFKSLSLKEAGIEISLFDFWRTPFAVCGMDSSAASAPRRTGRNCARFPKRMTSPIQMLARACSIFLPSWNIVTTTVPGGMSTRRSARPVNSNHECDCQQTGRSNRNCG